MVVVFQIPTVEKMSTQSRAPSRQAFVHYSRELKSDHLKSGIFEGQISKAPVFKWLGFSYGYIYSPNHSKTGPFWPGF